MRNFGLDLLRIAACVLVAMQHTGEFFYIGAGGIALTGDGAEAAGWFCSLARASVPLFVMISGFFILPVRDSTPAFFRRRMWRVALPFVVWCVIYAIYQMLYYHTGITDALLKILRIPVNYGVEVGHLWYVYMLLGLYLVAPVVTPWLQRVSKRELRGYLWLWALTLCLPYIHLIFPEVLGECYWNRTPMLYYFSGMMGYMLLAFYIKKFYTASGTRNLLTAVALIVAGYAATYAGFRLQFGHVAMVKDLELSWGFDTVNVAMLTAGLFLLFKDWTTKSIKAAKIAADVSLATYGIYLAHIIVLNMVYSRVNPLIEPAYIKIPLICVVTFVITYVGVKLISLTPLRKIAGYK